MQIAELSQSTAGSEDIDELLFACVKLKMKTRTSLAVTTTLPDGIWSILVIRNGILVCS